MWAVYTSIFKVFTADFLVLLLQSLTSVVVARYLGPEGVGLYIILLLIPAYAEAFGRPYFDYSLIYFVGKKKENLSSSLYLVNLMSFIMVIFLSIVFLIYFKEFKAILFSETVVGYASLMTCFFFIFPLRLLYLNYSHAFQAEKKIEKYNNMHLMQGVLTAALILISVIFLEGSLLSLILANIFGILPSIIYSMRQVHMSEHFFVKFDLVLFKKMAKFSLGQYSYNLISYLKLNIGSLFLIAFSGPIQIAFFNIGKTMADAITRLVPNAVNIIIYPELSNMLDPQEALELLIQSYRVTLSLLLLMALPVLLFSEFLILTLYGEAFEGAVLPFNITLVSFVFHRSSLIFASYFSSFGRTGILATMIAPGLALQTIVFIFYFSDAAAFGASCSFLVGVALTHAIMVLYFNLFHKCEVKSFIPRISDFKDIINGIKVK